MLTFGLGILVVIAALGLVACLSEGEFGGMVVVGLALGILLNATAVVYKYDDAVGALEAKDARYAQLETHAAKVGNLLAAKNTELNKAYARITAYEGQISNIRTRLSWSDTNLKKCEAKQQESTGSIDEIRAILEN